MSNFFFWLICIGLPIGGILLTQELLASKSSKAEKQIKLLSRYSKTIGILLLLVGIIEVIDILINFYVIKMVIRFAPVTGIIFIVAVLFSIITGLMLSIETISSKLANPDGIKNFVTKLNAQKVIIGFISIIVGLYLIIWKIIKFRL